MVLTERAWIHLVEYTSLPPLGRKLLKRVSRRKILGKKVITKDLMPSLYLICGNSVDAVVGVALVILGNYNKMRRKKRSLPTKT